MNKGKGQINRFTALIILLFIIYAAILSKLISLQIVNHEDYTDRANNSSTKTIAEQAPRGKILDSSGNILADSKQSYAIEYMDTEESREVLLDTLTEVFSMLDDLDEAMTDDLELKIDDQGKFYFDYGTSEPSAIKTLDLRFKQDRNLDYYLKKELEYFKGLEEEKYDEEDIIFLEEKMAEVTAEEMFYRLVKQYSLYELLDPSEEEEEKYKEMSGEEITELLKERYSLKEIRRYMVVLDAIKMQSYSSYNATTIASNISDESAFIFMQKLNDLPGIDVRYQPVRYYPYGSLASTVIGYMSSINPSEKEEYELKGYDVSTDKIGVSGIEAAFEDFLKGTKGGNIVKVNTFGRITEKLFALESYPGNNVQLTVDMNLQYTAERALRETLEALASQKVIDGGQNIVANANRGAVVVQEVATGRILAMASYPNYDPNIFTIPGLLTDELSKEYFNPDYEAFAEDYIKKTGSTLSPEELFTNDYTVDTYDIYPKPFFNYATQGLLPSGSTFKFVTAVAALEEEVVDPEEKILDQGIFNKHPEFTNYQGMCEIYASRRGSHGYDNMTKAFKDSCNYYFYELAYRLYKNSGIDTLASYAWKLGLGYDPETASGNGTGIEIFENKYGQVYSSIAYANLVASISKYEVVDMLSKGSYTYAPSMGRSHRPFDIAYNESDDEELAEAKKAIKDYVAEEFKGLWDVTKDDNYFQRVQREISELLRELVAKYEKEEAKKYTEDDYYNAAYNLARYIIYDKGGDLTSPGNLTNSSIGLGMNQFTPLQLCSALATVVNGGTRYESYLVDKVINPEGEIMQEYEPTVIEDLNLKDITVDSIKKGMAAVHSGGAFANFPIATGGKTGTAPFRNDQKSIGRAAYGVYLAFAPVEKPEIAVSVVLYDSAHGSSAAPVARAVMETYFREEINKLYPNYSSSTTSYTLEPNIEEVYNQD
ncbi:MAG: penicillin-binding transpeptidase domain-containing protein [Clostridiaceae bacterium]